MIMMINGSTLILNSMALGRRLLGHIYHLALRQGALIYSILVCIFGQRKTTMDDEHR
jgi:hypothetical protein